MATGDARLQVSGLTKCFNGRCVVNDVSFSVRDGEILCFVGPSGAGKSTIIRLILGLVSPDAGTVVLGGRDITHIPINGRNIGTVFQQYSLFPFMSVWENVAFPLRAARFKGKFSILGSFGLERRSLQRRVDEALGLVGLASHANKAPSQLSGGEQQRVAIARALVSSPCLLCFDEPFSALDKSLREDFQLMILNLRQRFAGPILYITHDQGEALMIASRLGILRDGRILQVGDPKEVYNSPVSTFVAKFLGECNVFSIGQVSELNGSIIASTERGTPFVLPPGFDRSALMMGIRPERLRVRDSQVTSGHSFSGTIVSSWFRGSSVRYEIVLATGDKVLVMIPGAISDRLLSQGDPVVLEYDPNSLISIKE
jgi:putative spermidine/putrescine transport system ATP-binding protein